jgi:hypothetical protein
MPWRGIYEYALEGRWTGTNMPWRGEVLYWYLLIDEKSFVSLAFLLFQVTIGSNLYPKTEFKPNG